MARIRTIKPEFWTDETIVQLPFIARLLFIGMWNFADDSGAIAYSPDRIRLQILPAEHGCDITGLIDLLVASGLIEYWVSEDGARAITIKGWAKHQKIDNPSRKTIPREGYRKLAIPNEVRIGVAVKYGCPPGCEIDTTCYYCGMPGKITWWKGADGKPRRWVTLSDLEFDHFISERNEGPATEGNIVLACRCCNRGKREFDPHQFFAIKNKSIGLDNPREPSPLEGIKDQGYITTPNGVVVANPVDDKQVTEKQDCPHKEIISIYHEVLPMCPGIRDWTPARAQQLRARWNEDKTRQSLDYWRGFFEYVKTCDFLVGRSSSGRPFFADLEWLTKSGNFAKVREAKYEQRSTV